MNSLGNLIIKLREEKNFSQRQLAMYANVSNTEISKLESGDRQKPNPEILKKIALVLNVNYEDLMKAAGYLEQTNIYDQIDKDYGKLESFFYTYKEYLPLVKKAKDNNIDPKEIDDYIDFLILKNKK